MAEFDFFRSAWKFEVGCIGRVAANRYEIQ
jgi:hypothetical protein